MLFGMRVRLVGMRLRLVGTYGGAPAPMRSILVELLR